MEHLKAPRKGNLSITDTYKQTVLQKDMHESIENEAFELHYQPLVEPSRGMIQGAEVLIRWNHKEFGLVPPGDFIPLAEKNGLIHPITNWIIRTVCAQLKIWNDNNFPVVPIAINIPPVSLEKYGLAELMQQQLEYYQLPGRYLQFEITENTSLESSNHVRDTLRRLRGLGIKIAIDDFGTGYASIKYLHEFKIDILKIDKIFIQNIHQKEHSDRQIVSSILDLAKGLNIKIVAEGVEEYEQFEFLKQKKCHLIQGYLFSRPVPLEKFEKMLKEKYLIPTKLNLTEPRKERRQFYRLHFPYNILGKMSIIEVNNRKVKLGSTNILLKDISIGGIKILSLLQLPIQSSMVFKFNFTLMNSEFDLNGKIVWTNKEKDNTSIYGVSFDIDELKKEKLSGIINKMTDLLNQNERVPDTPMIDEDPVLFLQKSQG